MANWSSYRNDMRSQYYRSANHDGKRPDPQMEDGRHLQFANADVAVIPMLAPCPYWQSNKFRPILMVQSAGTKLFGLQSQGTSADGLLQGLPAWATAVTIILFCCYYPYRNIPHAIPFFALFTTPACVKCIHTCAARSGTAF